MSLVSFPSWSETLTMDDLVERNDLYYKKFTNVPFTGEISGIENGSFVKGKTTGEWLYYTEDDELEYVHNYKDGILDGLSELYHENGQLWWTGNYKDGKQHGLWEWYYKNGQVQSRGNYKDGKQHGLWELYNEDGFKITRKYKNGVEVREMNIFRWLKGEQVR